MKAKNLKPIEEFWIVAASDVACKGADEIKGSSMHYENVGDALAEAAVQANPGDSEDGFPCVVYQVKKFVEMS